MKRIFLTGASGFLGRQILKELSDTDAEIICMIHDRKIKEELPPNVRFVIGSLSDSEALFDLTTNIDIIIHAAAVISFKKKRKHDMFDVNAIGTKNLVNAALENKVSKFIHISSIAAIGASVGKITFNEEMSYNLKPLRVNYSTTKYLAEQEVQRGQTEGLNTIILNPVNIIGPNDFKKANLSYVKLAQFKIKPDLTGGIGIVDVRDVAAAVKKCLTTEAHGQRYILSSKNLTYKEFLDLLGQSKAVYIGLNRWFLKLLAYAMEMFETLTTVKMPFSVEKARLANFYFWGDNSKSIKELGMTYISAEQSVADMINWYRSQQLLPKK